MIPPIFFLLQRHALNNPLQPAIIDPLSRSFSWQELFSDTIQLATRLLPILSSYRGILMIPERNYSSIQLCLATWILNKTVVLLPPWWERISIFRTIQQSGDYLFFYPEDIKIYVTKSREKLPLIRYSVNSPFTILGTSGSSGNPRLIIHSWKNHYYSARGSNHKLPLHPYDCWAIPLPFYHISGLAIIMRSLLAGSSMLFVPPQQDLYDTIVQFSPTHLSLVPTQLANLMHRPCPFSMKVVLVGGAPLPLPIGESARQSGWPIYVSYGSTEMASQIATGPFQNDRAIGQPLPYRKIRIDRNGRIHTGGSPLAIGYWDQGRIVDFAYQFHGTRWIITPDRGRWSKDGRLIIEGRIDRMIISGGEKIDPSEIEGIIQTLYPNIQAVVTGIPHPKWGSRPICFLDPFPSNPEILRSLLQNYLPSWKIPDALLPLPPQFKTETGKINRSLFLSFIETGWENLPNLT